MKKYMLNWLMVFVGLVAIVSLFFVFRHKKQNRVCKEVIVEYADNDAALISAQSILEQLKRDTVPTVGLKTTEVPLKRVEKSLRGNVFVKNAEGYFDFEGNLHLKIYQRKPIVRVHPDVGNPYYLDDSGKRIPLSKLHTPRVKTASGNISSVLDKKLYTFVNHVNQSEFWDKFIDHIFVRPNNDLVFTTQIGGHEVVFGDTLRMEQKLNKLEEFYEKASKNVGWEQYSEIDIRFKNQIVCRK
ncbi:MAG: hypothetical protein H6607_11925 [Flavobacteriales bacterium]|nr:hypothetical protein [Flavobacteriales bacterium]